MGIFGSDDGEGGTMAERIALIGILCFAFAWVPVFIVWKIFSVFRKYHKSPEQEVEAGNMPVTTNPAKPNRNSMQPGRAPAPSHRGTRREVGKDSLPNVTGLRKPGRTAGASVQKEYRGKRKPMPTQPVEPLMRMLPDTDDIEHGDALKDRGNSTRVSKSKAAGSRLPEMSFTSPWGVPARLEAKANSEGGEQDEDYLEGSLNLR
ncbi:hypothetical protein VMCG_08719 [Cytospora schulzeri]|uniref:Uncharacterized protein n=1 Tax=Cytospora schulzeri TaxID=448051 RepID=A0A423VQA9_9PEZI|nr:hypothetical protein VMCG_08719 [Valsa malicola]